MVVPATLHLISFPGFNPISYAYVAVVCYRHARRHRRQSSNHHETVGAKKHNKLEQKELRATSDVEDIDVTSSNQTWF